MADFSTLPPHIRTAYAQDPRYLRSQAMGRQAAGIQDIQHPLQGLAQMLMAYKSGEAQRGLESEYAQKGSDYNTALAEALQKIQPSTETVEAQGPPILGGEGPTVTRDVPGDYSAAANIMTQAGAPDLAMKLAIAGSERTQSQRDLASERAYGEEQAGTAFERAKELKGIAPAKERKIVKGADGRQYYADTAEPVLPGVKTPQEKFLEMLEPPAPAPVEPPAAPQPDIEILGVPEDAGFAAGTFSPEGAAKQPSVRDIFNSLPTEAQTGIKMSADPMKAFSSYLLKSKGLDIQFNEDGTISSITEGGPGGGWGKKATGTLEGKLIDAREGLARLGTIEQSSRPEFLQVGPRLNAAWSSIKESMGVNLAPEDKAFLADYSTFKMSAIENINRYIKEITGAQMSETEATRLRKGVPDPGDSWYSGDSPTQFDSKLKAQTRELRAANARYTYALKNGWDMNPDNLANALPLTSVEELIDERGAAIERQIRARQPDMPDEAIEGYVRQTLSSEFGMQ